MTTLTFHGAAGTVTGSKMLLESDAGPLLVDCGMFQGLKALRDLNWARPSFDARSVRWVALTHAHIDHSGWLPRLVKEGFRGKVFATPATAELAQVLLRDAAKLQEEDADFLNRKGLTKHKPALPLYDERDADRALDLFESVAYEKRKELSPKLSFRFISAGHLLGSAMIEVEAHGNVGREAHGDIGHEAHRDGGREERVAGGRAARMDREEEAGDVTLLFSGDVGRYGAALAPDPRPPVTCDVLVLESTYGDRRHGQEDLHEQLARIAERTFARGGMLLIPAFAVGRAQQVIFILRELYESGRLPRMPIHVDSPMAVDATRIYARYHNELDPLRGRKASAGFLDGPDVTLHRSREQSKQLNSIEGPRVIISSSGMLTGGRILHHVARRLPDPRNTILLVGYQAAGTRGRALCDGKPYLRVHGREIGVRAEVAQLNGMSGHADATELLRWTERLPAPRTVFLTHGEPEAAEALAGRLRDERGWNVVVPKLHERFGM